MQRIVLDPRPDWREKADSVGFTYHSGGLHPDQKPGTFWFEGAAYEFTLEQVETIEAASEELHARCLDAVDHVVRNPALMDGFGIPTDFRDLVTKSWLRGDPHVMGRLDLVYDPQTGVAPKMLEYNADTPTLVIETAVMQWFWLQDRFPEADQFNSLHEKLIERYRVIGEKMPSGSVLHFSSLPTEESAEEYAHVSYFADLASQAGIATKFCALNDVGWDHVLRHFVDLDGHPIRFWSKLWPWEFLVGEAFGPHLLHDRVGLLEPPWKMLMSNKAILAVLWDLFPNHPNLLPASLTPMTGPHVRKPLLAREGANITLNSPDGVFETDGWYKGASVYQALAPKVQRDGNNVVIGSWIVGDNAAGMIIREDESPIITSNSRVVPHFFR